MSDSIQQKIIQVRDLPGNVEFVSNSQDVNYFKLFLPKNQQDYDTLFVTVNENGYYEDIWGMYGLIPYLDKKVFKVM